MTAMTHDEVREAAALYAVGALTPAERASIDEHAAACESCAIELQKMVAGATLFAHGVPQVDPPAALRDRVLAAHQRRPSDAGGNENARPAGQPSRLFAAAGWLAAAAVLVVAAGVSWYAATIRGDLVRLRADIQQAAARAERAEAAAAAAQRTSSAAQARLVVLTAPDLRQITLAGQAAAPNASARVFLSRSRGLLFAAANLPSLPAGRTYQLWYLTPAAPVSAGLFKPDAGGEAAAAFETAQQPATVTGLAVSIEPEGGVPSPTGALYLVGTTAP